MESVGMEQLWINKVMLLKNNKKNKKCYINTTNKNPIPIIIRQPLE